MAAIPSGGFVGGLAKLAGLWLGLVAGGPLMAQDAKPIPIPLTENGATTTLHVYTNLVQVPVVVLAPNRQRLTQPIAPGRFSVSIGHGPWFTATHVRREGDDPIELAILLDLHGNALDVVPKIEAQIAGLAPNLLHTVDHVTVYGLDCNLTRGPRGLAASGENLERSTELALRGWKERTQMKPVPKCEATMHLREALGHVVDGLSNSAGRRAILAVTDGRDPSSKSEWVEVMSNAQMSSTAVFGLVAYPAFLRVVGAGAVRFPYRKVVEDPFNALCDLSGGMVMTTYSDLH